MVATVTAVAVLAGAGAGGYVIKHNADVRRDRQERAERIKAKREAAYQAHWRLWRYRHNDWQGKQADYQACKETTDDVFSALDDIDGQLSGGLNYNEYSDAVAADRSAVRRAIREGDPPCMTVTLQLARASDHYVTAAATWRKWYNDPVGSIDDLDLDPDWRKAGRSVTAAESVLRELKPGPEPDRPVRGDSETLAV